MLCIVYTILYLIDFVRMRLLLFHVSEEIVVES